MLAPDRAAPWSNFTTRLILIVLRWYIDRHPHTIGNAKKRFNRFFSILKSLPVQHSCPPGLYLESSDRNPDRQ